MYTSMRAHGLSRIARDEAPSLFAAIVVAEVFFKFHSFTLECIAFLATWASLSWIQQKVLGRRSARTADTIR